MQLILLHWKHYTDRWIVSYYYLNRYKKKRCIYQIKKYYLQKRRISEGRLLSKIFFSLVMKKKVLKLWNSYKNLTKRSIVVKVRKSNIKQIHVYVYIKIVLV